MKVVLSPAVEADLADIYEYTLETWGETQAAAYVDILVARFKGLAVNHTPWQARDDLLPGLYGRYEGQHLIVFRGGGDHLQIVRVLHQRMNPAVHFQPEFTSPNCASA